MSLKKGTKITKQWLFPAILIVGLLVFFFILKPLKGKLKADYDDAKKYLYQGNYDQAVIEFNKLGPDYQDVQKYLTYCNAIQMYNDGDFSNAQKLFAELGDFEESPDYVQKCIDGQEQAEKEKETTADITKRLYTAALRYFERGKYAEAYDCFTSLSSYKDSEVLARKCLDKWRQKCADHISAGIQFSGGVTVDGGVEFSGRNFAGEENIYKWSDIVSVAVGEQLIVGLKADGTLLCQGIDEELNKAATNGSNGWSGIVEIDTGWQHIVGLDQNGNIHIAGYNKDYLQNKMNEKKEEWENADIIAIATGGSIGSGKHGRGHIVALKSDGHVIAAGDNEFGQCEVSEWKDIVAIAAGDYHTVGLKSDGTVVTTQKIDFRHNGIDFRDSSIEIAKWKNIVEISAGYGYTLALQDNGEVVSAGNKNEHQRDVDGWNILQSVDVN